MNEPGAVNMRVPSPLAGITYASEGDWRQAQELTRRDEVARRRAYYDGSQHEDNNRACLAALGADRARAGEKGLARWIEVGKLPEHERLHPYSTQISESVDFLTHRLCQDFAVEAGEGAAAVQAVIDECLDNSPALSGTADDDELSVVNVTREALKAMDCPVWVRFDPAEQVCWLKFFPSDAVRLDFGDERSDRPTFVALWETHWMTGQDGHQHQVTIRREWQVQVFAYPGRDGVPGEGPVTRQCVESWWKERPGSPEGDELIARYPTGVPFVPWGLLRGSLKDLMRERGESIITDRAMGTADRYDAVEQHSWLAARHNSHATLGVIGDGALIQTQSEQVIHKDVADAVVFPGGTALVPLLLPTDPAMIEHQRTVLLDELYGCFGLARVDQSTLQGLGQVTGYALEILNTKTDSTFEAIKNQFVRDWKALLNTVLDCHAHWTAAGVSADPEAVFDPVGSVLAGLAADPAVIYPRRGIEVRTGSGGVADAAQLRDDYVAKVISRREVLRRRGYTDDEITVIEREIKEEAQADAERQQAAFGGTEGGRFGAPSPLSGVRGGTSSTPPGTVGGVINRADDNGARSASR